MSKNLFLNTFFFLILQLGFANAQPLREENKSIAHHPRLLLLKGEEQKLFDAVKQDSYKQKIHQEILKECNEILLIKPVERKQIGMRLLATSREALLRIFYLSYAYRTEGDERYLARAKDELKAISNFSDWNPSHFLDVAEMTIAASIGYDWLHHELSPQLRSVIKTAIIEKGLKPSFETKNNWWLKASHNWNQVCNAGMAFGALAIYEDSTVFAQEIIDRAKESIKLPMKDYEPDGSYPEGYMYWGYGTTFNVLLLSALEKAFGEGYDLSQNPGFLATASYMLNMTGPSGDSFNFSDSDLGGVLQPAMFWFAQKINDPSLLWVEKDHMAKLKYNVRDDIRILPLTLIWSKDINLEKINPPKEMIWTGKGKTPVALMRTSWTDPKAIYIGFKGGSPSTNHSHMDIGSFVMEANGVRWAIDLGRQDYRSLEKRKINIWEFNQESERWKVFRYNNFAHNTLSVNNKLQNVKGHSPIVSSSDSPGFLNAVIDMSSVYPDMEQVKRGLAISEKHYVVVKDEYRNGNKASVIRWTMVAPEDVKLIGKNKVEITKNGEKLIVEVKTFKAIKLKTWSTVSPNEFDAANPGTTLLGFEVKIPRNKQGSFTVFLYPDSLSKHRKVKVPKLDDW